VDLTPCQSSNVKAHGYDPVTRTLAVAYHDGGIHTYEGVPPEKYAGLLSAPSVGRFVAAEIKGAHPARKG